MTPEDRVQELKLMLPPPFRTSHLFQTVVVVDCTAYVAGHGPMRPDGTFITGKVGAELTVEQARDAARQVGLSILATLHDQFGSLNRVKRVVKSLGMVNCVAEFSQHPAVIDGYSLILAEVFGRENGIGARSAVGMSSLPFGMAVEIEAILQLHPQ